LKGDLHVTLKLRLYLPDLTEPILKALKPDNLNIPQNMKLELEVNDADKNYLKIRIESNNVGSIINTLNDIFSCLQPTIKLLSKCSINDNG